MAQATLDIPYTEARNRGTVAIRIILAIPHTILVYAWAYAVQLVSVIHWFIQVFTGKRNEGLFNFSNKYLGYATRVYTYEGLMFDQYPGFIDDQGKTPVQYSLTDSGTVNRLTVGLRLIWAIPAMLLGAVLILAAVVVTVVSWFAIVITGSMPRGMFDFLLRVHKYAVQLNAYTLLLTDDYPKFA